MPRAARAAATAAAAALLAAVIPRASTASATQGPAPPPVASLASAPQPVQAGVYQAPSVTNAWGSVQTSVANVAAFNTYLVPPLSSGWYDAVESGTLTVNGTAVPPAWSVWYPYGVVRGGNVTLADGTVVAVTSELRMVFESAVVLLSANVTVVGGGGGGGGGTPAVAVAVDFATPTRYYPSAQSCPSWHYPTDSYPCCFNFYPPVPSAPDTAADFSYAWAGGRLGITDAASPGVGAWALGAGTPPPVSTVGSGAEWVVVGRGAVWALQAVYAAANTTVAGVAAAAGAVASAWATAWPDVVTDVQARFDAAFDPAGGGHFSGSLPVLSTPEGALSAMYYLAVASLLATERTNLPVSLSGVPCGSGPLAPPTRQSEGDARRTAGGAYRYVAGVPGAVLGGPAYGDGGVVWVTGAPMNASTNVFYWDNGFTATALAMLEPAFLATQLPVWMGSVDPDSGVPSYWSFWGYDYAARRGIGNYYAANDMTLFGLAAAYLRATGDVAWLGTRVVQAFPNGTAVANTTMHALLVDMALHWRAMNASGDLADYGGAPNLLECVPSYINRVAGINAGNAWMMRQLAEVEAGVYGNASFAAALRAQADGVAAAVLKTLYVPPNGTAGVGGYFNALWDNGTLQEVRHVIDYVYTTLFLGVQPAGDIPAAVAAEQLAFVQSQLVVPCWMRALSLQDPYAPFSNRSDHGPSGAYVGWPALTVRAMGTGGFYADAMAFLLNTSWVASLGPYGQAVEVRPPGMPYKPAIFTLYNEMVGLSIADAILGTAFGFDPPLLAAPPANPLVDADVPRGFIGNLTGVRWHNALLNIASTPSGLRLF